MRNFFKLEGVVNFRFDVDRVCSQGGRLITAAMGIETGQLSNAACMCEISVLGAAI